MASSGGAEGKIQAASGCTVQDLTLTMTLTIFTLTSISKRLKAKLGKQCTTVPLEEELDQDYEALGETAEELEYLDTST